MPVHYNITTKKWTTRGIRGIVYIGEYIEFGYFDLDINCVPILYRKDIVFLYRAENSKYPLYWMNDICCYTLDPLKENNIIEYSKHIFNYPIPRCYNLIKLNEVYKITRGNNSFEDPDFKFLPKFTFGLEYETSKGNIPWLECLKTRLVPLYDGSINGHEYVTIPLTPEELSNIKNHLALLDEYTEYDQDCSLHIHVGGFPIEYNKISSLCNYWFYFQDILKDFIPEYSYSTELFKSNNKNYSRPWLEPYELSSFYQHYTNNVFVDGTSFYEPNSYDPNEERKWLVSGRYYNMNIMHLISGGSHKTVEFRFLRPTTNYSEIKWFLFVLSAFLNFVIKNENTNYESITLDKVLSSTFPENLVNLLKKEGLKLRHLHKIQINNQDRAGINQQLKEFYLKGSKFNL